MPMSVARLVTDMVRRGRSVWGPTVQRSGAERIVSRGRRTRWGRVRAALLASSALIAAALPAAAQDATWVGATNSYNTATNWDTNSVPTGTAFFGGTGNPNLSITTLSGTVGGWTLNSGAQSYTFTNESLSQFSFNGAGIVVSGGSATITNNGKLFSFGNASTAGSATITNNQGDPLDVNRVSFRDASTAGTATIINNGGLSFDNTSTAGNATITNNQVVSFSDTSTAGSATIINGFGAIMEFVDASTAGNATITNNDNVTFSNTSTAGNSKITNNQGLLFTESSRAGNATITNNFLLLFLGNSTADNATITNNLVLGFSENSTAGAATIITNSGANTQFLEFASGGTARFVLNGSGTLDISGLRSAGTKAGSIEGSGNVWLGSKNLAVGGNNLSTIFSGVISDCGAGCEAPAAGGSLTKEGTGTLTLMGLNNYTGATNVNAGPLIVSGSIASSSGLTVGAGALVGGTGTLPSTTINGTLSPGNSIGTLTVQGNLVMTVAAAYIVEISPSSADRTNVTGTASLGGTVQAVFGPGSYLTRTYTILSAAGGRSSTFGSLTTSGLPAGFTASLSYTATDAILNLIATLGDGGSAGGAGGPGALALTINQRNVANALNNFFNRGGTLPANFLPIFNLTGTNLGNALSQLSGEPATGAQQVGFQMTNQFLGLMLDPFVDGRSGIAGAGGPALGFAPEREDLPEDIALAYSSVLKAPPTKAPSFEQRWSAWGGAYGGSNRTSGDPAVVGSHDLSARAAGFAAGLDYHLSPNTIVGVALAGGGTNWSLADGLGGGKSDAFQAGLYGATRWGPAYLAAALSYTNHWMSTDRFAFAGDHLTASFNAQSIGARVESGYRFATIFGGVTPYAAVQAQNFRTPSYSETDLNGGGFALAYAARTGTDTRSELGARFDRLLAVNPNAVLALRARLAWAHDWVSDPTLAAVFQTLPGASFVVNGATPARDSALASAGTELRLANGVTLLAKFDGEFASHSSTYAGTGTVRYTW
jgi:autotransporter-associated beta strand protein